MNLSTSKIAILASLTVFAWPVFAQSFQPKSFQFKGAPEYSTAELSAAASLKKGAVLTAAEMGSHTKLLMDSGVFENITYTFDGQDLTYQMIPSKTLYTPQLENFPFQLGPDFDSNLHTKLPLYHGKVPMEGTLLDGYLSGLKGELAAKGIEATLTAAPFVNMTSGQPNAISVSITSPAIRVGEIQLTGASPEFETKARLVAAKSVGAAYNSQGSPSQIETGLNNFYKEQGYLQASAHAAVLPSIAVSSEGVAIPFALTVTEGPLFRLGSVHLADESVVSQAAFDKQSLVHPGEIASLEKLRSEWLFVERQCRNKGLMKAKVIEDPTYDVANHTVTYEVRIEPGPVYSMGTLKVTNATDDLQKAIASAWQMPPGATFNEGSIRAMTATHGVNPQLEKLFQTINLRYSLTLHDDTHTVDVAVALERKQ